MDNITSVLHKLGAGQDLSRAEAEGMMHSLMNGEGSDAQIGALLMGLRQKGETIAEIAALARVMREHAAKVNVDFPVLDCCGTGGDGAQTFNVSTTAAFILAAAGVKVAKHGNRALSSRSGSADVLEALGIAVDLKPDAVEDCLREVGIGFMFAPAFHPGVKHVMPARKALGMRTIFNVLGPLSNPAGAEYQLIGVYSPELTEPLARVLMELGTKRAMVVHGSGLDEVAVHGVTQVSALQDGKVTTYSVSPADFGLVQAPLDALVGGDAQMNATILRSILNGTETGPKRDFVLANAAAGLLVAGKVSSLVEGVKMAEEMIGSGKAMEKVEELREKSQRIKTGKLKNPPAPFIKGVRENLLNEIFAHKRVEVEVRKQQVSLAQIKEKVKDLPLVKRSLLSALQSQSSAMALIAEIKRQSPSRGVLQETFDVTALAQTYAKAGAEAISVLTDGRYFGGSLADLEAVRAAVQLPVLQKDFMVDAYQIYEARLYGADAILLIVAMLEDDPLKELMAVAVQLSMEVLVETHTAVEIDRAVKLGAKIIGINARDLSTMQTDLASVEKLAGLVPSDCLLVAESAVESREDVVRLQKAGAKAVLVGTSLMVSRDAGEKIAELMGIEKSSQLSSRGLASDLHHNDQLTFGPRAVRILRSAQNDGKDTGKRKKK